jgi:tetratricopeptide (TPR) repeat protein
MGAAFFPPRFPVRHEGVSRGDFRSAAERVKIPAMYRLAIVLALLLGLCVAQSAPPRSGNGEYSSSKDTKVDLSPPPGDSNRPLGGPEDVQEFHPYDPHRAEKNVEVGNYYLKRGNYPAAISRYREALQFKPNDAIATFQLGVALEKSGALDEACQNYESYLKILPRGPSASAARKALDRLKAKGIRATASQKSQTAEQ